jgi:two-component system phosphate regulon sensor histidine kinase PhoR
VIGPILRAGLFLPAAVLIVAAIAWAILGAAWAASIAAAGLGALVGHHLWNLDQLVRWASGELDAPVPEGRGAWRVAFSALHGRARIRIEQKHDLADTIERFRRAVEAVPDGMIVLDPGNRIRLANARAEAHFGLDPSRDIGAPLVNFARQPEFLRYLEHGDHAEPLVIESQRTPGQILSIQIVPFGVDERLLISRDITRLEAVARMRRDFIANVSHELKTPLTVVSGFLETLEDVELDLRAQQRYLGLMRIEARRMERLVDDLLTLSTLESEQNTPQETPFAIEPLLLELSAAARALSNGQHAVALDLGEPATITGSRDELLSACANLVSNAVRYTPAGGTITLAWRATGNGGGAFSVADTGIGIAPEHLPRLTERFYRVDRSRSRATGGTGLGLAIVKHVLLRHQAELAIESTPGVGSTFTVRLPARRVEWKTTAPSQFPPDTGTAAPAAPQARRATSS